VCCVGCCFSWRRSNNDLSMLTALFSSFTRFMSKVQKAPKTGFCSITSEADDTHWHWLVSLAENHTRPVHTAYQ
jgi:hypothetical protein